MTACIELLDQALEVGERELVSLTEGDLDSAEQMATDRAMLIQEASKQFADQDTAILRGRLDRLLALQRDATEKAAALQEDIRSRLGRTKKEVKRFSGYANATKPVQRVPNKYLNRQG